MYMYASKKVCKIQFFENIVLEMFKYFRFYSTFQLETLTRTLKLHTFLSIQRLKFNENCMNLSILCPRHQVAVPKACISFKSYLLLNAIKYLTNILNVTEINYNRQQGLIWKNM